MNPYFYSLEMLITGRATNVQMPWGAMDALAAVISDETQPVPSYFQPLLSIFLDHNMDDLTISLPPPT
jgi:hypothetical protein